MVGSRKLGLATGAVSATETVNLVLTIIVGTKISSVIQQLFCAYNSEVKQGPICGMRRAPSTMHKPITRASAR